jgi:anti-anti-sigma regulatory factor
MANDPEFALRYEGALTCATAPGFCRAIEGALYAPVARLQLNLEEVKYADAVGLAALLQAARRARQRGITCSILPSAVVYRALRRNGFFLEGSLREARSYDGRRWDVLVFSILEPEMRAQRARDGFPSMSPWPSDADT